MKTPVNFCKSFLSLIKYIKIMKILPIILYKIEFTLKN